jgi:hypothetical protein
VQKKKKKMTDDLCIICQKLACQSAKNAALCVIIAELKNSAYAQQKQLKALNPNISPYI